MPDWLAMMKKWDILGIALWNAKPEQVKSMTQDIMAGAAESALRPIIGPMLDCVLY